jgi:predicted Na+-dependent transporter
MLSMGLSLTVSQILQPLRNARLVIMALAANFVVIPAAAGLVSMVLTFPTAAEFGKRSETAPESETAPGSAETTVST